MSRPLPLISRLRLAALAATAAVVLAGCNGQGDLSRRSQQPLSPQMVTMIQEKGMTPSSPILVRLFKQESELEVWKQKTNGTYALLKTYPICRWSGELGPKVKMGDRQAPEGFYAITPALMNPNSSYYLAINTGFPNAFDKSYGRTGEFLMIHGDCSSSGCYAMTDQQIAEIFALARESFAGGQRSFQLQAMPFRMTPKNLARHRTNPNMAFWRNLKEGYDSFEVTKQEPKVNVCDRHYVFNAQVEGGRGFDASAACPNYTVPAEIANAVAAKRMADDQQIAALSKSLPVAPVKTGTDGGMHPVFLAKFRPVGTEANDYTVDVNGAPPGTMPETTRPPGISPESQVVESNAPVRPGADPASDTAPTSSGPRVASVLPPGSVQQTASLRQGTASGTVLQGSTTIMTPGTFSSGTR
ncbi:MAG: murein L,D-transpeptidase family protein [Pseudomonadota bacterium]